MFGAYFTARIWLARRTPGALRARIRRILRWLRGSRPVGGESDMADESG
jgi:hypothetical protein